MRLSPAIVLFFATALASAQAPKRAATFPVEETTIAATQAAIRAGKVTCHQLVEQYLARIRGYDQTTRLNTVVMLNPEAMTDADRLDRDFAHTHTLLPLQGIVVVVKDNYDTRGLQTTGGSLALKGFAPTQDAFMVKRLRDAGAIILFKSNMAEWAFSPVVTESSIAGVTRNPYDLARVPAGSSGGTAAAVAANLVEVGIGTDTGDSIRGPASHNDLVGIRPTIGLTSRDGIIPLNIAADVGGPLARTVADAATMLTVLAGADPADPVTQLSVGHVHDYTRDLNANALRGARIGVLRRYSDTATTDPEIKALLEQAIADLKARGAIVVDPFDLPDYDKLTDHIGCGNFQADLNSWFAAHAADAPVHSLQQVVDSGLYLPYIEQQMKRSVDPTPRASARACPNPIPDTWHDEKKAALRNALLAAMEANHVDVILYPTWSNAPRLVGDLESPGGDNNQVLSPMTGFPAITVPMGFTHGSLPAGLQFLGRVWSEGQLFGYAYAYEQATHHRKPPAMFGPIN